MRGARRRSVSEKGAFGMRKMKRVGGFLLSLFFNMLLNARGLIPAAVLLVLHYVLRVPIWLSFAALGIWIAAMIVRMLFFGWAGRCSAIPDPPKENKNPYSAGKK